MGGAKYETIATSVAASLATNTITGDVCCAAATTKEYHATASSATALLCAGVFTPNSANEYVAVAAS